MPRLRAVVAAALVTGALAVPHAEAAPREFVLTGSRTSYVDIDLDWQLVPSAVVVETRGRYGGVVFQQLSTRSQASFLRAGGIVSVRGLSPDPDRMSTERIGDGAYAEPGRVRVYLIADGPTTVRFEADGPTRPRALKPARRAVSAMRVARLTARDGVWSAAAPFAVAPTSLSLAALQVRGERSWAAAVSLCLREPRATCPEPVAGGRFSGTGAGDAGTGPLDPEQSWAYAPVSAQSPRGSLVASATVDPLEPLSRAVLVAFTLDLVG